MKFSLSFNLTVLNPTADEKRYSQQWYTHSDSQFIFSATQLKHEKTTSLYIKWPLLFQRAVYLEASLLTSGNSEVALCKEATVLVTSSIRLVRNHMEKSWASLSDDDSACRWSHIFNHRRPSVQLARNVTCSLSTLWSLSASRAQSVCTCLTQCCRLTTEKRCITARHTVSTGTYPLSHARGFFFSSSSKDANLKFRFHRHVSLRAIKSLLPSILFEISRETILFNILTAYLGEAPSEMCAGQIWYMQSLQDSHQLSPTQELLLCVHYVER